MNKTQHIDDLNHFVAAQKPIYSKVLNELKNGKKRSHWMWFIFPQIIGLGFSSRSKQFAIHNRDHGIHYLDHSILGARLKECTSIVNSHKTISVNKLFGYPDYMKFHSSMTLFEACNKNTKLFTEAINIHYNGERDVRTLEILKESTNLLFESTDDAN